ncbi:nucleotidyltransferase family protein [Falsigemmobacter faecalis]|uniref:Nucleotidyltransferase family protein n=1 Tax=Falsigemmobacter faecalis TaxID=2488730 RepID=A0A3P3DUY4_9RHOB|nr:nucleotidyltransferase family protein [Falsigemmobacter faecalis]RRH77985.1 nucleotidyltransferase family protein [Falsigemmobacter faecalis]
MRNLPRSLMLFAAGFGTRMAALTAHQPKPLIKVAGRALIDHALNLTDEAGIAQVVVNIHYRGDQLREHLAGRGIAISDETDRILETGGGLRKALPLLGEGPVYTLNSDAVWTGANPLRELGAAWEGGEMRALLLLGRAGQIRGRRGAGDFSLDEAGRISRGGDLTYLGAQILCPEGLHDIPEDVFSLNRLWDVQIAEGTAFGVIHEGLWCDVGHPEGIQIAEEMIA